jgi:hypothetical protein
MLTNREIHELASVEYAKRNGHERVGYSVRWEVRRADGTLKLIQMANCSYADHDVAGFMSKRAAFALGRKLVRDGYTGVQVYATRGLGRGWRAWDDNPVILSADTPEVFSDHPVKVPVGTLDERLGRLIGVGTAPTSGELDRAYDRARHYQGVFWQALKELETLLGFDVDGAQDLNDTDVETLVAIKGGADDGLPVATE